jgi:excisionase family DNA binding protein
MSTMRGSQNERAVTETPPAESGDALRLQLRQLARLLPEGATVMLDRSALERLAGPLAGDLGASNAEHDLTVAEAAEALRLSTNRVRALIAEHSLDAFRIAGRGGWRITADALRRFRAAGAPSPLLASEGPASRVDLGRWRRARRSDTNTKGE